MTDTEENGTTVLIVEDDEALADLYAEWLSDEYGVRTANDGQRALEELDETVDVVVLDRRMPGMSGDEVLEAIRERGIDCRVVMVTAVSPDFDIIDMGFDDYVVKPIDREELQDIIERMGTRSAYDETVRELHSLIAKRSALESEKTEQALQTSEEYRRLEERIEAIREDADATLETFDERDFEAAFRDIGGGEEL